MMRSKKYALLHQPLTERIYLEESRKHKRNLEVEKAVKGKLHQLYGAFVNGKTHREAEKLLNELPGTPEKADMKTFAGKIAGLHASTRERLPYLQEIYDFIGRHIPSVETILDFGCGFNPFTLPLMPFNNLKTYYAYDIDVRTAELLNRFFLFLGLPQTASCVDLIIETPAQRGDLALLCKLVPVLEAQKKGIGFRLLREINAGYAAVTYPLKSLGGKNKGMEWHYSAGFEKAMEDGLPGKWKLYKKVDIGSELLYLLR